MRTLLIALTLVLGSNILSAQHKIGYIYGDSLLVQMPEYDTIRVKVEQRRAYFAAEIQKRSDELKRLYTDYDNKLKEPNVPKTFLDLRLKELQEQEQRIQEYQQTAQEDLMEYQSKLAQPLIDRLKKAVEEVAKEKKYDYIVDAGSGGYWYLSPGDDMMAAVRKKLGIK